MGGARSIGAGAVTKLLFVAALIVAALHYGGMLPSGEPARPAAPPRPTAAGAVPSPTAPSPVPPAGAQADGDGFVLRRVLNISGPLRHGDYVWDDAGVPAGPILVTVDLAAETLSVFRDGYEIGTAVILFGADAKPTPLGTYPILQKDRDHVSNLYDAPMPYMLRLTNDGVSIHASEVAWDAATHGCIGVPKAFAQKLFAAVKVGDRVIVTRGRMMAGAAPPA